MPLMYQGICCYCENTHNQPVGLWMSDDTEIYSDPICQDCISNAIDYLELAQQAAYRKHKIESKIIDELNLTVMTKNVLKSCNCYTIGDILKLTQQQWEKEPNMGRKRAQEINDELAAIGVKLKND